MNLPQWEKIEGAKVIGRTKTCNYNNFGKYNTISLFKSILYDVEFPDGKIKEYSASFIDDNMYAQVDNEGCFHNIVGKILDYKQYVSDVDNEYMYITTKSGQRRIQKTSLGWKFLV